MQKLLLSYVARLTMLGVLFFSCGSGGTKTQNITIVGTWKLKQEYSNEGGDTPLKEFPLSTCDKATTLEIMKSGRFVEKSYYENSSIAGECAKNSSDTRGDWKKGPGGMFLFVYDKDNTLSLIGSKVTLENGELIISAVYTDRDMGPRTKLKFIYSKV